jgi:rhodanese-related sulfurtransferase
MKVDRILTLVAIGLAIWFVYTKFIPMNGLENLSSKEFEKAINSNQNSVVIDVREVDEFNSGYIPGSVNIPLSQLEERLNEIPKDKDIYLYCRSGNRSKQAAKLLMEENYTNLAHLEGGISSWDGKINN